MQELFLEELIHEEGDSSTGDNLPISRNQTAIEASDTILSPSIFDDRAICNILVAFEDLFEQSAY